MTPSTTTTAFAGPAAPPPDDIELRPLDWWAKHDFATPTIDHERHTAPIPAFVRLSRLIDPNRRIVTAEAPDALAAPAASTEGAVDPIDDVQPEELTAVDTTRSAGGNWVDSAGRPLFQIGLAAIVAAVVVGFSTFGTGRSGLTSVESSEAEAIVDLDVAGPTADGEQTREVLDALARQAGAGDADLSVVGTATGAGTDIRWTATVRNEGPETAQGPIMVVHTIGSSFELVSMAGTGWDCRHNRAAGTITCELDDDLATGQRRRLGIVTTDGGAAPGSRIPSTMSAVSGSGDPDLGNNTVNVTAITGPAVDADAENRSRSTGASSEADSEDNAGTSTDGGRAVAATANPTGLEELPRTGSGLAFALGGLGIVMCLSGRRLTRWSSRAQTRTLLDAAIIN